MSQSAEPNRNQFIDLSNSIRTGNQTSNMNTYMKGAVLQGEDIAPVVWEMVVDEA